MATTILIHTGGTISQQGSTITLSNGLAAVLTFANDTKSQNVLLDFYTARNLGPANATNRQKLEAVVAWLAQHIQGTSQVRQMDIARQASQTQVESEYRFE